MKSVVASLLLAMSFMASSAYSDISLVTNDVSETDPSSLYKRQVVEARLDLVSDASRRLVIILDRGIPNDNGYVWARIQGVRRKFNLQMYSGPVENGQVTKQFNLVYDYNVTPVSPDAFIKAIVGQKVSIELDNYRPAPCSADRQNTVLAASIDWAASGSTADAVVIQIATAIPNDNGYLTATVAGKSHKFRLLTYLKPVERRNASGQIERVIVELGEPAKHFVLAHSPAETSISSEDFVKAIVNQTVTIRLDGDKFCAPQTEG